MTLRLAASPGSSEPIRLKGPNRWLPLADWLADHPDLPFHSLLRDELTRAMTRSVPETTAELRQWLSSSPK